MLDFKPPKENKIVIGTVKLILPLLMRLFQKVVSVDIDATSFDTMKSIDGFPTIFVPNHPTHADSHLMFTLSKRCGRRFRYMAARETFDQQAGGKWRGFIMTRLGAYSIVRGAVDRDSFRLTRETLAKEEQKLVIFGEGEVSHQNETIMPFECGIVQFGFWALSDMERADNLKPLYLVPVGLKYIYKNDMWGEIDQALTNLEQSVLPEHTALPTQLYDRVKNVGAVLLMTLAKEYQLRLNKESALNEQIELLRAHILSQMEHFMGIVPQPEAHPLRRVRIIQNQIDEEIYRDVDDMTEYEREIHTQRIDKFRQFFTDLRRIVNSIAIYEGYIGEDPSQERFLEVITRFEVEVFGRSKVKGPMDAFVRLGTPKNLLDAYEAYKKEKRQTTQQITVELETEVQNIVENMP
jgi:hypothetical protein